MGIGISSNILWMVSPRYIVRWDLTTGASKIFNQSDLMIQIFPNYPWRFPIVTDSSGKTWFGTGNGLTMYDGSQWKLFTLEDGLAGTSVNDLAIDKSGLLWIATDSGVNSFNGSTWKTYTTEQGLAENFVWDILIDQAGNKWFGTMQGVSKFNGSQWTTWTSETTDEMLADGNVWTLGLDAKGNILAVTDYWVSKYDGQTWIRAFDNGWDVWCHTDYSNYVVGFDQLGRLWSGSMDRGLKIYDGTDLTTYTAEHGLSGTLIYPIIFDSAGNAWIPTEQGVSKFDGNTWTTYYMNNETLKLFVETPRVTTSPIPRDTTSDTCLDRKSRLRPGMDAVVVAEWSVVNSGPGFSYDYLVDLEYGTVVKILIGPMIADWFTWWKVESTAIPGGIGWIAESDWWEERYLEPFIPICGENWSQLEVGKSAIVTPGASNRVRSAPYKGDNIVVNISAGTVVKILEGPACADGLVFWKVENAIIPGGVGWTAEGDGTEYWLVPYP